MNTLKNQNRKPDVFALFLPEIKELISKRNFTELKDILRKINSMDIAAGWFHLNPQERLLVFKILGQKKAVEVFEDLRFEDQLYLLTNLNSDEISNVLNEMAPDERSKLFKDLPDKKMRKFLNLLKAEEANNVKRLLTYKENTAGSLMTTDVVEIKKEMTARKALLTLQENLTMGYTKDVYSAYVTDDNHMLIGAINLQTLLKAPQDMLIKDVLSSADEVKIPIDSDKREIANHFSKYDLLDAPVVDKQGRLLGVITIDDVVDLIERQATRDIYEVGKMSSGGGEIINYKTASVTELIRRRAGWLIALLIFDFLTGTVLKSFEATLSAVVALTFFIPMLLDTGGNAGAQTSITIIRGLATGDVTFKNAWKVAKLELVTALLMAVIVGGVALGRAFLLQKEFFISLVVGITMCLITLVAISTGIALPLLSKKMGLDPAVLAGPITTSVVDVVGLIIYFKIAQLFVPALRL
ncbi:MAG: magnesium transporter [Omnitrophica bacterium RIFCSPLOWO2_01_FULL_45_10]|nr:MAG: magnesium transporter [Omnitrophica bacterium RIFCSPLOWO2_01_FULL_45_10]